jgi:hypothetical protein
MAIEWTEQLDPVDLAALIPMGVKANVNRPDEAIERIGTLFQRNGLVPGPTFRGGAPNSPLKALGFKAQPKGRAGKKYGAKHKKLPFWSAVKNEFVLLCCTNEKKYNATRKALKKYGHGATVMITSTIAAAIASVLGLAVGVCVPIVSMLLLVVVAVGKNGSSGK